MSVDYSHKHLKNPIGEACVFTRNNRNPTGDSQNSNIEESSNTNYNYKKQRLISNLYDFHRERQYRADNRTIEIPAHIEYVRIYFHKVFDKELESYFRNTYGLSPIVIEGFNHTVLFAVTQTQSFDKFADHINDFYNSSEDKDPHGTPYSRLLLVERFEFLKSQEIAQGFGEGELNEICLLESIEILGEFRIVKQRLLDYLKENDVEHMYTSTSGTIEVVNLTQVICDEIINNFDIISSIQSVKNSVIRPSDYGTENRAHGFVVQSNADAPIVGVIDTGVSKGSRSPISSQVESFGYDLCNESVPFPMLDISGHGTAVAGVVVLGTEHYENTSGVSKSKARIVSIKVLDGEEGNFSIHKLIDAIRIANKEHGVRIFNLSVLN